MATSSTGCNADSTVPFAAAAVSTLVLVVVLNLPAASDPDSDPQLHFDLGEVYLRKGEYALAADHSRTALALMAGKYNTARHNLAVAYYHMGRYDDAIRDGLRVIDENPSRGDTPILLGRAYDATSRPDLAESQFQRALRVQPESGMAHYYYGMLLYRSGRYGDAIPHLAEARAWRPRDFWICYDLGRAYHQLGRLDRALSLYGAALETEARPEALVTMGAVYLQRGDLTRARDLFERAAAADPQNLEAGINLGLVDLADARMARAVERLERVVGTHPDSNPALRALLQAYESSEEKEGAARVRRRLQSLDGGQP